MPWKSCWQNRTDATDTYETCNDIVLGAYFRMAQEDPRAALNWLRARRPEEWAPRAAGPNVQLNQTVSQSFRQLNVQQLSDSALAQYKTLLGKMIELAKAEPHAVLDPPKD